MAETFVKGRVQHVAGWWGPARPCRGAKIEILDKDVGNPDDLLWAGGTGADGAFTAESNAAWRDRIKVQVPILRPPFHEQREVDDPLDVKLLAVRVSEQGRQHTFAPVALTPGGELVGPLVVPWGPPRPIQLAVNGTVHHALPPGAPAAFAQIRIEDHDPSDGSVDLVFEAVSDLDGRFGGMTRDAWSWLEQPTDAAILTITVGQGAHRQSFPAALVGDRIQIAPLVVPWGPSAAAATPCGASPFVLGLRAAEVEACRLVTRWGYDDGLAGCANPIPPWTVPPPGHTVGLGAKVAAAETSAVRVRAQRWPADPFDSLDDYRKFFPPFDRPRVLDRYPAAGDVVISDQEFADQRLAGPNPVMLRRVNAAAELPAAFGGGFVALLERCKSIANLEHMLRDRRLYMIDYEILGDPPPTTGGKYMPCPFALFGVLGGRLAPLAIQIERRFHATANPVFIPVGPAGPAADASMWNIAKLMVQVADMCTHELQSHLHDTHLAMEPFAVAMARTMSTIHPISLLLAPHFMGMIAKNAQAREYLLAPVIGPVQRVLGLTLDGSKAVVRRAAERWSFPAFALPRVLRSRGLDDTQALPEYPYRDDGLVIWNAISAFVTDYVGHTYSDDGQITGCDSEVQRWLAEVREAGRRPSVPAVRSRAELAAVLTQIIFTCSAQHSAVNFAQWDYMAFVPNMPGSAYARPLPSAQGPGEARLARILPGADAALDQTNLMWKLAGYQHDQLGRYDTTFHEPWAADVRRFQDRLAVVETQLATADAARRIKYDFLRPSRIINSINV
jgi:arachidonate 15-lipoxygenase